MEVTLAEGLLASELSVPEGTTVISRQQQSFIGGTPWLLQTAFYPMTFVTYGADRFLAAENLSMGTHVYIRDTLGTSPETWLARLVARLPDDAEEGCHA